MKDKLAAIDVSSIEELQRIKVEQDVIRERLQLLEDKRDDVSEEVYERVHLDYASQVTSLEQQAEPLKVQARAQYVVLKGALVEIEALVETSEMDREELLLRNDLGEFSEEDFTERLEECEARIVGHQEDLSLAQALRERFLLAFHSEEELEEGLQPEEEPQIEEELQPEEVPETEEELQPEEVPESEEEPQLEDPSQVEEDLQPEEVEEVLESDEEGPTVEEMLEEAGPPTQPLPIPEIEEVIQDETGDNEDDMDMKTFVLSAEEVSEHIEAAAESSQAPDGATMILSWPKLIMQTEKGNIQELTVAGVSATVVGSGDECDIVISGTKVASRHAEISLSDKGYSIRDLSTPVGTLVNGVEITEWSLSDGDTIQLGDVTLMFRDDALANGGD